MSDASTAILRPNKRFDFHAYRAFRDAYELELAKSSVHCLVIDLQEVQYIDSAALAACLVNPITHSELQPALLDARS